MTAAANKPARKRKEDPEAFPVVAIGASAGGLDALRELFSNLPDDTGMAFVVIQHLSEDAKSFLSEILGRSTTMPVLEATEGAEVQPGHVYVMPASADLAISGRTLRLVSRDKAPASPHLPIDRFFRLLAEDLKHRAIGVVLSGTGSDGSQGSVAIKVGGGSHLRPTTRIRQLSGNAEACHRNGCG